MILWINRSCLTPLACLVFVGLVSCQMWTENHSSQGKVEKGRAIFQESCAVCHGVSGKGDGYTRFNPPPANLKNTTIQKKTDEALLHAIREGHADTAMGAWKFALSESEIHAVLAYIRTFRGES